jgi:hypothetical protein
MSKYSEKKKGKKKYNYHPTQQENWWMLVCLVGGSGRIVKTTKTQKHSPNKNKPRNIAI